MAYCDYVFYTGKYHGKAIAEDEFSRLIAQAGAVVDRVTFGRAAPVVSANVEIATIEAIRLAACAVAEELSGLGASGGAIASESVGRYSVTYAAPMTEDERLTHAARRWLAGTGLMYRGADAFEW